MADDTSAKVDMDFRGESNNVSAPVHPLPGLSASNNTGNRAEEPIRGEETDNKETSQRRSIISSIR